MSEQLFKIPHRTVLTFVVMASLIVWSAALPVILQAHDTIQPGPIDLQIIMSDSAPGVTATHTISFKIATGTLETMDIGGKLTVDYQTAGASASSTSADLDFNTDGVTSATVSVNGAGNLSLNSVNTSGTQLVFDIDAALQAEDVVTIVVPGIVNPNHVFNADDPLWATTHEVWFTLETSTAETYPTTKTRVAIIDTVTMTATIDTVFEFSVAGLAQGTSINGVNTTYASTPTSLDFQTLSPGEAKLLGHELQVATNASNGFIVTVQETQELTSSLGEKIHRFVDTVSGGEGQATPIAWASPTASLDNYETYGHYGITTDDGRLDEVTESTDADFTGTLNGGYIGNFHQEPRVIFGHTGPTDAGTQDTGMAKVGVRIEISSLQPAGDDYTNTLVYVATPTF